MTTDLAPIRSGFCNPSNPIGIHDLCPGDVQGHPCKCEHHFGQAAELGITATVIDEHLDEQEYHRHPGSLSVSGAKTLLKAPALFKHQQAHPVFKSIFDFGSAAHAMVLGEGAELVVHEFDPDKVKAPKATNAWKDAQAECRARGAVLLLPEEYAQVQEMANKIANHPVASRLLAAGRPEVSAFAVDPETGVMRRGRADFLSALGLIVDYKSAANADPKAWAGKYGVIAKLGYDLQAEWYLSLFRDCGEPVTGFCWIVQEKEAPYIVTVVGVDESELTYAAQRNRVARQIFRDCTESDVWPGYIDDRAIAQISLTEPTYETELVA